MRQHAVTDLAPTLRRAARSFVPWYMHPWFVSTELHPSMDMCKTM